MINNVIQRQSYVANKAELQFVLPLNVRNDILAAHQDVMLGSKTDNDPSLFLLPQAMCL